MQLLHPFSLLLHIHRILSYFSVAFTAFSLTSSVQLFHPVLSFHSVILSCLISPAHLLHPVFSLLLFIFLSLLLFLPLPVSHLLYSVFSLPLIYYMLPYLFPSVIVTCPVPLFSYPILLTFWFSNCILSSFSFLLSFIASFIAPLHLLCLVLFFCSAILSCLIFYAQLLHPVLNLLLS